MTIEDTANITLIAISILFVLSVLTIALAWRADRAASMAGPLRELEVLDSDIDEKRRLRTQEEEQLKDARERTQRMAEKEAQILALENKLDELETEWAQSAARREEVQALRLEVEAIVNEKLQAQADLDEKSRELRQETEKLDEVRDRLDRAEDLVHRIDGLTAQLESLKAEIEEKQGVAKTLRDAESQLETLAGRCAELETRNAQLNGEVSHRENRLEELTQQISGKQMARDKMEDEKANLQEDLSRLRTERSQARNELEALEEGRGKLDAGIAAREERLEDLAQRVTEEQNRLNALRDGTGGTGAPEEDPLCDLKQRPQVIETLLNLDTSGETMSEHEGLARVKQQFRANGLEYPDRVLHAFHTAMKVNQTTQMAVLAGISGTGKSQLPRHYAAGMGIGFQQVPVQPRWDSPQDLMGFYNYIEQKFRPTDMARALWAMDPINNPEAVEDRMLMVLLDEMNLARVEYYFSDFMSRLESRPATDRVKAAVEAGDMSLIKDALIELEIPKATKPVRIFPGYNLLFAGTMNEDESTQALSDKVFDRANVLRFAAPKEIRKGERVGQEPEPFALPLKTWNRWTEARFSPSDDKLVTDEVAKMAKVMTTLGRPFGHRLGRAIMSYVHAYPELELGNRLNKALADQIEMRLLPRLRGVQIEEHEATFGTLKDLAQSYDDDALAGAIDHSVTQSAELGQFTWFGVTR